jgi:hypothetical protein
MKKSLVFTVVFCLVLVVVNMTYAQEVQNPIIIKKIFVSDANNLHFRVISHAPNIPLCTGGPPNGIDPGMEAFAYVNESDSGAKGKMATLMTAYALGKYVTLVTEPVQFGPHIYCHIVEFWIW